MFCTIPEPPGSVVPGFHLEALWRWKEMQNDGWQQLGLLMMGTVGGWRGSINEKFILFPYLCVLVCSFSGCLRNQLLLDGIGYNFFSQKREWVLFFFFGWLRFCWVFGVNFVWVCFVLFGAFLWLLFHLLEIGKHPLECWIPQLRAKKGNLGRSPRLFWGGRVVGQGLAEEPGALPAAIPPCAREIPDK